MKSIPVKLGDRSYRICIGALKTGFKAELTKALPSVESVFIVTTQAVEKAGHLKLLRQSLPSGLNIVGVSVLPNGERIKDLKTIEQLQRQAVRAGLNRRSAIVALGGGVITDLAGFLAATYMRGISFVSVPTTLLAMVDASIGGKTGVDLPEGKNLVGAFWQPKLVWLDPLFLKTLPPRQWRTGLAEVIKYGVILDPTFFTWLEKQMGVESNPWKWTSAAVEKILSVSATCKARVVSADERETPLKGGREILNYGHTIGHALEAATGYTKLTHGEAISIGMVAAGRLALSRKLFSEAEQTRQTLLFMAAGLPVDAPKLSSSQTKVFWSALLGDKKNVGGSLRFVLPEKMGRMQVISGIQQHEVRAVLE